MKNALYALVLAALAAACGAPSTSHVAQSEAAAPAPAPTRVAFALTGSLGQVQERSAQPPASGLWTEAEVQYQVPCTERFESFSYAVQPKAQGGVTLLVSAVGTRVEPLTGPHCMSIRLVTKKITLPGIVAASDVTLVNLTGAKETLAPTTKSLEPVSVSLVSAKPNCPVGAPCLPGNDHTVVTLRTAPVSCVDKIGPVTFAVTPGTGGKVTLAVSVIDMVDSRLVRCASIPRDIQITVPHATFVPADVALTVVGG